MAVLALALVAVLAAPAAAYANFTGYNRADIVKWTPKGSVSSKTRTRVSIHFADDDGNHSAVTVLFWADRNTKFWVNNNTDPLDPEASYSRVSRNAFFKTVGAPIPAAYPDDRINCNVSSNVTWKWRKDAHGKRYRYLTRLRITAALMG